jgi:hypothetical protein
MPLPLMKRARSDDPAAYDCDMRMIDKKLVVGNIIKYGW